jgi:hypothetical protein
MVSARIFTVFRQIDSQIATDLHTPPANRRSNLHAFKTKSHQFRHLYLKWWKRHHYNNILAGWPTCLIIFCPTHYNHKLADKTKI